MKQELKGKVSGLVFLQEQGFNVPAFFIIPSKYFLDFLNSNQLTKKVDDLFRKKKNIQNRITIIKKLVVAGTMPIEIEEYVKNQVKFLNGGLYSIRSSSVFEDSHSDTYAGQFDSFLDVRKKDIFYYIKKCWASAFNYAVFQYSSDKHKTYSHKVFSVIVQQMIQPKFSGVGFSINPLTKDKKNVVLEFTPGRGDMLMSGIITPQQIIVSKKDLTFTMPLMKIVNPKGYLLPSKEIKNITRTIIALEKKAKYPCDVEWVFDGKSFYILQCRPITD